MIKQLASNMTRLRKNGVEILFSYETPVAGYDEHGAFKTDTKFSSTTTRHISKYFVANGFSSKQAREIPQADIEAKVRVI
tara:strand:- start:713 stop:952 length:240 start_codon:yes stop_codon:yes gene_type:complete